MSPLADDFFEARIRPVLVTHCYDCHADSAKSGLRVDSREALLKGGKRGPAIVPGKPEESLLLLSVRHTHETLRMPKGGAKLQEKEIADLAQWIKDGAVWPATRPATNAGATYLIKPEHRAFWSFQPLSDPAIPPVKGKAQNPIDAFLLEKLEAKGLSFNAPADKRTLLRRATYDLTGLPPTRGEIDAFLADRAPNAFEKVIDRLLASPRYGERWGRHWLDVARYSDTLGMTDAGRNLQGWFPYAYTYRDWVIRAFNEDMPYDQFIRQQLAADKVKDNDPKNLAALGFVSLTRGGLNVNYQEKIDDKIDVVSRGLLGLTVSCARCHNHKFDPIPTADYYSLYSVFHNTIEPEELPLLDPKAGAGDKWELERKEEEKKVEAEIAKIREKRYPELKALYRSATEIGKALELLHQSRGLKPDGELQKFAQEKDYNPYILTRWRRMLDKSAGDAIWTAWQALGTLSEAEFKQAAPKVLSSLDRTLANRLVLEALEKPEPPASMKEVAERYGKLLASHDKPDPLPSREEETLRLALHGPEAPPNAPFADYEKFRLTTDKQLEDPKRQRLVSLFLAQAWRGAPPRAQSVQDRKDLAQGFVFLRGKPDVHGEKVDRQFLLILAGDKRKPFANGSGRLELADAIIDPANPLTSRVMVNRVWAHHFGAGLVRTPSDFGTRGEAPTHPALLDYLSKGFINGGWSIKKLHRQMMLTRAYQQSSADNDAARVADPENRLLWKMNRRRLDFEELRDSLLAAGGKLDPAMGGLPVSAEAWPFTHRRTIYSFIDRALVPNDFRVFDFASPESHAPERQQTTVPQQALMLMNSPFVMEQAEALMQRAEIAAENDPRKRIAMLYQTLYGRRPSPAETAAGLQFIREESAKAAAQSSQGDCPEWQYGEGEFDEKADRVKSFTALPWFINGQWRNTPFPGDPRESTAGLSNKGGSLGDGKTHSAIRRWIAPFDGRIAIKGLVEHNYENACSNCKGVFARVVSGRTGSAGKWTALLGKTEMAVASLEVKRGDTIDFVVEGGKGTSGGEFKWAVEIKPIEGSTKEWNSVRDFRRPSTGGMNAWDRYAQVLLATAEFMMVD